LIVAGLTVMHLVLLPFLDVTTLVTGHSLVFLLLQMQPASLDNLWHFLMDIFVGISPLNSIQDHLCIVNIGLDF